MFKKVTINSNSRLAYISTDFINEGFVGEIDAIMSHCAVILIKPGTDLETLRKGLLLTIQDIEFKISEEQKQK
jgi:hypothetical protein